MFYPSKETHFLCIHDLILCQNAIVNTHSKIKTEQLFVLLFAFNCHSHALRAVYLIYVSLKQKVVNVSLKQKVIG